VGSTPTFGTPLAATQRTHAPGGSTHGTSSQWLHAGAARMVRELAWESTFEGCRGRRLVKGYLSW
jgi:hypothetical protein